MQPFDVTPSAPQNRGSGPITVRDVSDVDLGDAMSSVTATGGVLVKFFFMRVKINTKNAAVNATYENRLCVAKQPKSDRATVATTFITEAEAERQFPREYAYFTTNEEAPTEGTPLAELPGITQSQVGILMLNGLRSIEDLGSITADQAREIGFEAIQAHKLAAQWVARVEEQADLIDATQQEARFETEIQEHQKTNTALKQRIKELEIENQALMKARGAAAAPSEVVSAEPIEAKGEEFEDFSNLPNPLTEGPDSIDLPDPMATSDED